MDKFDMDRLESVADKIARLVHLDDERLRQEGRDSVVKVAERFWASIGIEPKDSRVMLTTTWLLKETLLKLIHEGGEPRYYTVCDRDADVFACACLHPSRADIDAVIARLRKFGEEKA